MNFTAKNCKTITVIGDGSWGTTLAVHLAHKGYAIRLWGPFPKYIRQIAKNRYNSKFLPGIKLPPNIQPIEDLQEALEDAELVVFAIPSKFADSVITQIPKKAMTDKVFLSVTKGIETDSLRRISEMTKEHLGPTQTFAVLSGPTIATEVAKKIPSTAVVACPKLPIAKALQTIFSSPEFRIYTNTDVAGVEIGGSIKNVIALACGVCDGLGYGSNTKAAIVTRGLAEMTRLGKLFDARQKTFSGLSGLGDLITTCFSPQSRNRTVGEKLGKGNSLKKILSSMQMVAEGVDTAQAIHQLSVKHSISMPITAEVYNILYKNKKPAQAVTDLMTRKTKSE